MVSIGTGCVWTAAMLVLLEVCVRYRSCYDGRGHARAEGTRSGVMDVSKEFQRVLVLEYEFGVLAVGSMYDAVVVDVETKGRA